MIKNVYDIRYDKSLYYIIPSMAINNAITNYDNAAVFAFLYYKEPLNLYLDYLNNVPCTMKVYIAYANEGIRKDLESFAQMHDNVILIKKENRGRDISALLVAFRETILKYKYICFVHDKKESITQNNNDMKMWIKDLWDNTLISKEFMDNVLNVLECSEELGLLVPPEPLGDVRNRWCKNTWAMNYKNTCDLAERIGVTSCDIDEKKPAFTLGTAFWCKVDALRKLFEYKWEYSDFDEEPLRPDGTLSHAVERIFAYVAQDAGYDTGVLMSDKYAQWQFCFLQNRIGMLFDNLEEDCFNKLIIKKQVRDFIDKHDKIYLYGAGKIAEERYKLIYETQRGIAAVVVSEKTDEDYFHDLQILEVNELKDKWNPQVGIILGIGKKYKEEVLDILYGQGISENSILDIT